jgi:SAM-dependent methyltransferase
MTSILKRLSCSDLNERQRIEWVESVLKTIPAGRRLLDAGAGEQRYRRFCSHLDYVAQDFGQYDGSGDSRGLQTGTWDASGVDIVSDITAIPRASSSFDVVLCTEVLEHVPDPLKALDEFARLLRPGGKLIMTAPFGSLVHFAPYFFATGFSRYWYEHHLSHRGFVVETLTPNGDWFDVLYQETLRLPQLAWRANPFGGIFMTPFALMMMLALRLYRMARMRNATSDIATFGFHCVARKV